MQARWRRPIAVRDCLLTLFILIGLLGCVGDSPYRTPRSLASLLEDQESEIANDGARRPAVAEIDDAKESRGSVESRSTGNRGDTDAGETSVQFDFLKLVSGEGPSPDPPASEASAKAANPVGSSIRFDDPEFEFNGPGGEKSLPLPAPLPTRHHSPPVTKPRVVTKARVAPGSNCRCRAATVTGCGRLYPRVRGPLPTVRW